MKWFTSDLHFAHPFVAALRGYALPGYAKDASIKQQAEHEHKPLKNCVDWRKHDADIIKISRPVEAVLRVFLIPLADRDFHCLAVVNKYSHFRYSLSSPLAKMRGL